MGFQKYVATKNIVRISAPKDFKVSLGLPGSFLGLHVGLQQGTTINNNSQHKNSLHLVIPCTLVNSLLRVSMQIYKLILQA